MKREVRKIIDDPDATAKKITAARLFSGKSAWLQRFTKRWRIVLRRKTNVKKVPITERAPKLKRWAAIFHIMLLSHNEKRGHHKQWSIYPPNCRWSLDEVPAGPGSLIPGRPMRQRVTVQTGRTLRANRSNGSADGLQMAIGSDSLHAASPVRKYCGQAASSEWPAQAGCVFSWDWSLSSHQS